MTPSSKTIYFSLLTLGLSFLFLLLFQIIPIEPLALLLVATSLLFGVAFILTVTQMMAIFKNHRSCQIEIQKLKYLESEIKFYRQHRHDLKNHLIIMYELARLGNTEDLKSYASEFIEKTDQALLTLQTGNQEIDVLLYSKLDQARKNLIEVNIHNSTALSIHNKRIVNVISILSNLFDNAIEACMDIDNPDDRNISLTLEKDLFNYTLIVTNTFNNSMRGLERFQAGSSFFGKTHKKDKEAHGMGLKIVQALVLRLEGSMQIDIYNQQFFQVKITLPVVNLIQ